VLAKIVEILREIKRVFVDQFHLKKDVNKCI
jgi:hypothetical protein